MAVYEIYLPPGLRPDGTARAEEARFVADRASIWALIFPFFWLAWHRLWFWLAVYVLVMIFLNALAATAFSAIGFSLSFLPGIYVWLEGPNMIASKLETSGWAFAGVVEAPESEAAAIRWLDRTGPADPPAAAAGAASIPPIPPATVAAYRSDPPGFGLFGDS